MTNPIETSLVRAVREAGLEQGPILVAVSGGPDSVALAHLLHHAGIGIEMAHFDHQTRDGASADDARLVEAFADTLGVPFHVRSEPVEQDAESSPMSFEEFARERRYAFFVETARRSGCQAIATGHHADDQAETVLMRVLRGTTPRGLAGIPRVAERDGIPVVRPLLEVRRVDILAYVDRHELAHCHDATNQDTAFLRNRIRHELLPQLTRQYNPRLVEALNRLATVQGTENDLLRSMTQSFADECLREDGAIDRDAFAEGHRALQRRLVLDFAWGQGVRPDFDHIERAIAFILTADANKVFDLGNGVRLTSRSDSVSVAPAERAPLDTTDVPLAVPGTTSAFGARFRIRIEDTAPEEPLDAYCTRQRQVVDAALLAGDVVVRHRRPGDRISPLGLGGARKLKDYFGDLGIPPEERDRKRLIVADGEVMWIVGHAVSAKAAVTDATLQWATIEVDYETG